MFCPRAAQTVSRRAVQPPTLCLSLPLSLSQGYSENNAAFSMSDTLNIGFKLCTSLFINSTSCKQKIQEKAHWKINLHKALQLMQLNTLACAPSLPTKRARVNICVFSCAQILVSREHKVQKRVKKAKSHELLRYALLQPQTCNPPWGNVII